MDYFTTTSKISDRSVDCVVVGVYERGKLGTAAAEVDEASKGEIKRRIKSGDISSDVGKCVVLTNVPGVAAPRVAVVGLGPIKGFNVARFRKAIAAAVQAIAETRTRRMLVALTLEYVEGADAYYLARHTVQTTLDALYRFTEMKSGDKPAVMPLAKLGFAIAKGEDAEKTLRGAEHGDGLFAGMSLAKDLGNLPPNVCTPSYLASTAERLASDLDNVSAKILSEADMKRLGMLSLLAVTAGTSEPAKLIQLEYKGAGTEKPVVLVGKGVTFDSGGISLKPGPNMDEMKFDMCGAASVIGALLTVATLKLPINVTVIVPAVENLPSGTATRPGDIVKSMSGQTIEILNTDAEGRLILCDALTYARRFKPSLVIDVATLTGACVIALGHHHTGIMANDPPLAEQLLGAGVRADDRGWQLPITEDYAEQLKSNFADFANIGGREGGAITAGCFLGKFTDGLRWAHLDIAGTAWLSGPKKGATGRPVPMLCEFLLAESGVLPKR